MAVEAVLSKTVLPGLIPCYQGLIQGFRGSLPTQAT
jgi:hypothetical protein